MLVASRGPVGGLQNALPPLVGLRAKRPPAGLGCGVARNRSEHSISSGLPAAASPSGNDRGDRDERLVGELRVRAGRRQRDELVAFASRFEPRCWAIEGATGTGALLAQQLVAIGETVLDVPPTLSARARLLDTARIVDAIYAELEPGTSGWTRSAQCARWVAIEPNTDTSSGHRCVELGLPAQTRACVESWICKVHDDRIAPFLNAVAHPSGQMVSCASSTKRPHRRPDIPESVPSSTDRTSGIRSAVLFATTGAWQLS